MENGRRKNGLVLFGIENTYFSDVAESAIRANLNIVAGIVTGQSENSLAGVPVVLTAEEVSPLLLKHPFLPVHIGPADRIAKVEEARSLGFDTPLTLIDPTSVVSPTASLEDGCYINALNVVASGVELSRFVFVGRNSSIGHHSRLEAFSTVGPGVTIASHCHIDRGVMIGAGATLAPNVTVGVNAIIGAGTVVIRDVPPDVTVVGNPARIIRTAGTR